ncbi:hypothetical protein LY90DRAFT_519652 [Neocallimastix californiae]|uniref:Uncharacterized protein n=1 Tax=Neocallimastix californiae TaxID=1754190 RepID=A0A1Y1YW74_9FUNG|nr:hypothetical protein LY90DRAFT_519652 [Neocallimastix californiae]|eukprot:ORY02302.1 hypothetical protein LY90DRAFT_519652 [Neocallimastix californiae]
MVAICCCVLIIMFLNSSICLLSKAAKSVIPTLLLELSPWLAPDLLASALLASGLLALGLLVSAAAAGLGFVAADFSGALVVSWSPVFWRLAGRASTGVGLFSATTLPDELGLGLGLWG